MHCADLICVGSVCIRYLLPNEAPKWDINYDLKYQTLNGNFMETFYRFWTENVGECDCALLFPFTKMSEVDQKNCIEFSIFVISKSVTLSVDLNFINENIVFEKFYIWKFCTIKGWNPLNFLKISIKIISFDIGKLLKGTWI